MKCFIHTLSVLLLLALAVPRSAAADVPRTTTVIFAAASLKNALDDAAAAWRTQGGPPVTINYGASNALAKQIEQGAPADLFISADLDWMRYVSARDLTQTASEHEWLGNRLVLIAPRPSLVKLRIAPDFDLIAALDGGRLALCNPAVPAGKYGQAALQALGVWPRVEKQTALADNVRAALALVARGEAPLGIVYASDAQSEPKVRVVDRFREHTHPPIVYPIALLRDARGESAAALLDFLESAQARPYFEKQGFIWLGDAIR